MVRAVLLGGGSRRTGVYYHEHGKSGRDVGANRVRKMAKLSICHGKRVDGQCLLIA